MNRILKILPFLLLCAFALQVMPVGAQQQMFLQRTQQSAPTAGLLDSYKGAAFAAAPDVLLYSTYSATDDIPGSQTNGQPGQWSVAVLRDFDDAIKSFTPSQVADGTANTWVQALGPSDGFVRRWYDQSVTAQDVSNLNHADQEDKPNMPKLFDSATGLILENGKAALDFDGTNDRLITPSIGTVSQPTTHIGVLRFDALNENSICIDGIDPTLRQVPIFNRITGNTDMFAGNLVSYTTNDTNENLYFILFNSVNSYGAKNGVASSTIDAGTNNTSGVSIGSNQAQNSFATIKIKTFVLFGSDQSSNRTNIETAINNEYNIY